VPQTDSQAELLRVILFEQIVSPGFIVFRCFSVFGGQDIEPFVEIISEPLWSGVFCQIRKNGIPPIG
jgi:hypothetical protein